MPGPRIQAEQMGVVRFHIEARAQRSEEHTSELQSRLHLVCRLLLEKKKITLAYRDSIRVANEAISDINKTCSTIIDPLNIQDTIAELVPYIEPDLMPMTFPSVFTNA